MKRKKKIVVTLVALFLAVAVIIAAVLLLKKDTFGMTRSDRAKVVAKVGSETVTANELAIAYANYTSQIDTYNMYYTYYGIGQYFDVSTDEGKAELKQAMLDSLVSQRATVAMAKEKGITLTAEEQAECKQAGKDAYQQMLDEYTKSYENAGYANPANYALTAAGNYISDYGLGTKGEFVRRETYAAEADKYSEKLTALLEEESGITEEQLPALYEEFAAGFKDTYTDGLVATYDQMFANGSVNYRSFYIPEDKDFTFIRVIQLSDEARAAEMFAEIEADPEKFETYCMSEENLDALMPKVAAEDSYAISATDSAFADEIYAAAKDLELGAVALVKANETITLEDGTETEAMMSYIIRSVEGQTGIVPFEKVKDAVGEDLLASEKSEYVSGQINAWIEAEGNVSKDEAVYESVKAK